MEHPAPDWPRVAVVGPGAVGCFFGGRFAQAGATVTLFGRPGRRSAHLDAVAADGLTLRSGGSVQRIAFRVAERPAELADHPLVLFCVKSNDTAEAARQIKPDLRAGALVASLQNGVDNPERLRQAGIDALGCVVFVGAELTAPGVLEHRGRGDLVVGADGRADDVARFARLCESASIPCPVSDDIRRDLWLKLILNSMANAISALTHATYGEIADHGPSWSVALEVAREARAVAARDGVELSEAAIVAKAEEIVAAVGSATSSTEQDVARGRPTEIDALNGYIARRGERLGVATPVNQTLFALVKLIERRG